MYGYKLSCSSVYCALSQWITQRVSSNHLRETHNLCIWLGCFRQSPSVVDSSVNSSVKRISCAFGLGVQAITVSGWFSKVCCFFFDPGCHGRHSPQGCSTHATCLVVLYINGQQKSESNSLFFLQPGFIPLYFEFLSLQGIVSDNTFLLVLSPTSPAYVSIALFKFILTMLGGSSYTLPLTIHLDKLNIHG